MTRAAWAVDPALQTALRWALACLLLASSRHKLRDLRGFGAAVARYRILPERLAGVAAAAFAACEIGLGAALLVPGLAGVGGAGAAALLAAYTAAIVLNLARGRRHIDCGCAGPGAGRPLGEALVVRNVLLVTGALLCALPTSARAWVWLDALTALAGAALLALLYAAADGALANAPQLRPPRGLT